MTRKNRLFLAGLALYLFSLGLRHLEAPHWLALGCALAAAALFVLYLRQTELRRHKSQWLRRMLGREK